VETALPVLMEVDSRKNGRISDQLRSLAVDFGVLKNSDGSAIFSCGNTRVLAAVNGPVTVRGRPEQIDRSILEVSVEPFSEAPSLRNAAVAETLREMLSVVVFDSMYPRTTVSVHIQPLQVDGSFLAAAFNAAVAALLDAGIPMIRMAFAGNCVASKGGCLLLDPDAGEEELANSSHLAVFDSKDSAKSLYTAHSGTFSSLEELLPMNQMIAEKAVGQVTLLVTESYKQKLLASLQ
jgi:ribonuclease PH